MEPLDSNWLTGFSEGDSTFTLSILTKTNQVEVRYSIALLIRDTPLIHRIQKFYASTDKSVAALWGIFIQILLKLLISQ